MRFFVSGRPVSQQRPRVVTKGGKTWAYHDRPRLAAWRDKLILAFRGAARNVRHNTRFPVTLQVAFIFDGSSVSGGYTLTKEDIDHCLTVIMDAAQQSGVIENDNQVVQVFMDKRIPGGTGLWQEGVYVELLAAELFGPQPLPVEDVFRL